MAIEIRIPRLGWAGEEATFACWRKQDGEKVNAGEALIDLEGDKALQEVESLDSGTLRLLPNSPKAGDLVQAGQLIGYLLAEGEALPAGIGPSTPTDPVAGRPPAAPAASELQSAVILPAERPAVPGSVPSTPRARRIAVDLSVDLAQVAGSGKGGRIRERDVRAAAAAMPAPAQGDGPSDSRDAPISVMRRVIADRMIQSLAQTAPVTLTSLVDVTNLVGLRRQFKSSNGGALVPAYTDIIAKLVAATIVRLPAISGQWQGNQISLPRTISIGIAVDTEHGLVVPVVRDVPRLTLTEVTRASRALIEAAHARKLKADDMAGGVFTITNLGTYGVDGFTPIINQPESAILGLGAIRKVAAVVDGKNIMIRDQMTVSLTFDHRVLDGAPAARFLQTLVEAMENPMVWLLEAPPGAAGSELR
jgi:pyruvate dehydrogenase E2 component (dihydrolipoamide acetyltransferase)